MNTLRTRARTAAWRRFWSTAARLEARKAQKGRAHRKGMTLLEIMIVIAILGLVASVVVVAVMNQFENAKIKTARMQAGNIMTAVENYYLDNNDYPKNINDLVRPVGGLKPYLEAEPKDPWGTKYEIVSRSGSGKPYVMSAGPDKRMDTDDDVSTQDKKGR